MGLLGLCWGVGAALVVRHASVTDVALVMVVLAGILAASLSTLGADAPTFFAFLGTIVLPLFVGVLASGHDRLHLVTALIAAFYAGVLTRVFRRAHVALLEHLQVTARLAVSEEAAKREGFRQLVLGATLPGVPLYAACGFEPVDEMEVVLADGVAIACVSMAKSIAT